MNTTQQRATSPSVIITHGPAVSDEEFEAVKKRVVDSLCGYQNESVIVRALIEIAAGYDIRSGREVAP